VFKLGKVDQNTIEWMLQGPTWLKFAVERRLLGLNTDIGPVLKDPVIIEMVNRLKSDKYGISAIKTGFMNADEFENPYWDLYFLADLGFKASELNLNNEIEKFLETQLPDGTYITEFGMEHRYYCKSAILLSSVVRMGYQDDPHINKYVQSFLNSQRLDGGWYCNPNHDTGNYYQNEPSCPQNNLNILLLLGQYPKYQNSSVYNGAIDLLLKHWEMRNTGIQIVYFGAGKKYQSLKYPATRYGILRVLDVLSLFPYSLKRASFHNMLDFVHNKSINGKYNVESSTPYTDLDNKGQPNRLLTYIISIIDNRVSST
jgi:hypothetical protein